MKFGISRRGLFKAAAGAAVAKDEIVKSTIEGGNPNMPSMPSTGTTQAYPAEMLNKVEIDYEWETRQKFLRKQHLEKIARGEFTEKQERKIQAGVARHIYRDLEALKSISNSAKQFMYSRRMERNHKESYMRMAKNELSVIEKGMNYIKHSLGIYNVDKARREEEFINYLDRTLPDRDHDL